MDREALKQAIGAAFTAMRKPPEAGIVPHECPECDELRVAFAPHEWPHIPDEVLKEHCWDMPLLSDDAKQYYLPAWLIRSIEEPESCYTEAVLFALSSDHGWQPASPYTEQQWWLLEAYLEFVGSNCDEIIFEHVVQAQRKLRGESE